MNKIHKQIGAIIREYREKAGMTQLDLAIKLGYDTSQFVSMFERGICKVPYDTIGQLVLILGIPERKTLDILVEAYREEVNSKINDGKKSISKQKC